MSNAKADDPEFFVTALGMFKRPTNLPCYYCCGPAGTYYVCQSCYTEQKQQTDQQILRMHSRFFNAKKGPKTNVR